jgi:hypothetical protein
VQQDDPEIGVLARHDLVRVFAYLGKSELPTERLARLEWTYLQALGYDASPATLSRLLAQDPAFFVDVVSRVYRPSDADAEPDEEEVEEHQLTEQERMVASNAYRLLSEWKMVPGKQDDGTVDGGTLNVWVADALERLKVSGLLRPGEHHIGAVLAAGPGDPDGFWPCIEIRDLLERLQNVEVEHGMRLAIANRRGATSRGVFDGGDQERELAAIHREQAGRFADKWPRMAAILEDLAQSYERQARRHDAEAERLRRGFDR